MFFSSQDCVLLKPEPVEPERSFFPKDLKKIHAYRDWMQANMGKPANGDVRSFQQYNLTFSLANYQGNLDGYNVRVRCFVHPLLHGELAFSNWQLTVKSSGNGSDRYEYETDDDLLYGDLPSAFDALTAKFGDDLPEVIRGLNPNQFYVHSVLVNSRIGSNGVFEFEHDRLGTLNALLMFNSDDVLFSHPNIVSSEGQLMITGRRPEAEFEFKNIAIPSTHTELANSISKKPLFMEACDRLYDTVLPHVGGVEALNYFDTNKVEAADKALSLSADWANVSSIVGQKPEDYLKPKMKGAILQLIDAVSSPYIVSDERRRRTSMIDCQSK